MVFDEGQVWGREGVFDFDRKDLLLNGPQSPHHEDYFLLIEAHQQEQKQNKERNQVHPVVLKQAGKPGGAHTEHEVDPCEHVVEGVHLQRLVQNEEEENWREEKKPIIGGAVGVSDRDQRIQEKRAENVERQNAAIHREKDESDFEEGLPGLVDVVDLWGKHLKHHLVDGPKQVEGEEDENAVKIEQHLLSHGGWRESNSRHCW